MKLIREFTEEVIAERIANQDGKKNLFLEGIFMQSEVANKNNRIYPKGVMESAVDKYITEKVNNGTAYGEFDHPSGPKVNPDRVSHLITELKWDGNDVYGKAKVGGPMGDAVEKLIDLGGKVGVSTRGLGSLKENTKGIQEVQNDFRLATAADVVIDPSAPSAFVKGILENVEFFYDPEKDDYNERIIEPMSKKLHSMTTGQINEAKMRFFEHWLETLKNK
mgnify:CR=1 FL=1